LSSSNLIQRTKVDVPELWLPGRLAGDSIAGDSDLTTPIQQVRKIFPNKRLIVVFPPNRQSAQLKKAANGYLSIGEDKLRQNQLPNTVMTSSGFALHRPTHWK